MTIKYLLQFPSQRSIAKQRNVIEIITHNRQPWWPLMWKEDLNKIFESTHISANNCNARKTSLKNKTIFFTLSPQLITNSPYFLVPFHCLTQKQQQESLSFRPIDKNVLICLLYAKLKIWRQNKQISRGLQTCLRT